MSPDTGFRLHPVIDPICPRALVARLTACGALAAAAAVGCAAMRRELPAPAEPSLARIERQLVQREYWASENARGLQAPNRVHGMRTYFTCDGIRVVNREDPAESPELLGLRFDAWGREGVLARAGAGELSHANERVEIRRLGLVEWFVNGPQGLEHGFTVETRPAGEGELVFDLATEAARARLSGDTVLLDTTAGRTLRYGNLAAHDANGRALDAHFAVPAPDHVQLVIADADAAYPLTIDPLLSASADAELESDQEHAQLGWSVASAGDVNGDGYADVIVGAYLYDAGSTDEGAAFVFHGSASGIASASAASAATQLESNQSFSAFGASVASAGDVNGDGYADVIVGAWLYDSGTQNEGSAFIHLGSASGIASGGPLAAAARLESNQLFAYMGHSVSSAGDVNGDGYDDVIVGADSYSEGQSTEGAAFVYHGSASGIATGGPSSAAKQLEGDQPGAVFGASVSSAGDFNGDGYADVIVGSPGYELGSITGGVAFVYRGSASGIVSVLAAGLHPDQAHAAFGASVSSAGDVNGDGYDDVIVGAPFFDLGETDEGVAFIHRGHAGGVAISPAAKLESNQASAEFGYRASGLGDVDGDGFADVIVGSPLYDAGETDEGAAFVYRGSATGIASGGPAGAAVALEADQASAQFGHSVAAGDLDGDGRADALVGAPYFADGETDEGAAFVYLPEPGRLVSLVPGAAALLALRKRRTAMH